MNRLSDGMFLEEKGIHAEEHSHPMAENHGRESATKVMKLVSGSKNLKRTVHKDLMSAASIALGCIEVLCTRR